MQKYQTSYPRTTYESKYVPAPKRKVVAFVPAKGNSSRVKAKNTRYLGGYPLFVHMLKKLMSIPQIDEVWLDSEDEYILNIGGYIGAKTFKRDPALATNETEGHKLFENEVKNACPDGDIYLQVMCTSPFLSCEKIIEAIDIIKTNHDIDSVVMVRRSQPYPWERDWSRPYMNTFQLPFETHEGLNLYAVRGDTARALGRRIGDKPYALEGSPLDCFDIDYEEDWDMAELIQAGIDNGHTT